MTSLGGCVWWAVLCGTIWMPCCLVFGGLCNIGFVSVVCLGSGGWVCGVWYVICGWVGFRFTGVCGGGFLMGL